MTITFHYFFKRIFFCLLLLFCTALFFSANIEAENFKNTVHQKYYYFPQSSELFYLRYNIKNAITGSTISYKGFAPLGHANANSRLSIHLPNSHGKAVFQQGITDQLMEDIFLWQFYVISAYEKIFNFIVKLNPFPDIGYILMAHNPAYPHLRSKLYYPLFLQLGVMPYQEDFSSTMTSPRYATYCFGFEIQFNPEDYVSKRRNIQSKTTRR